MLENFNFETLELVMDSVLKNYGSMSRLNNCNESYNNGYGIRYDLGLYKTTYGQIGDSSYIDNNKVYFMFRITKDGDIEDVRFALQDIGGLKLYTIQESKFTYSDFVDSIVSVFEKFIDREKLSSKKQTSIAYH